MSQENNLNIADILNEIKEVSDEQIQQINNNWHGIPGDRVLIYKGVMSALENNNYEQMHDKLCALCELYNNVHAQNAMVVHLDVKIIMSFVEKILEKADGQDPENQQWSDIVHFLFDSLGKATFGLQQSGTTMMPQDLSDVISLTEKVLKCVNVIHTNLCFVGNSMFAAINNFVSMLGEGKNIETEDVAKIINLAQSVADDKDIKWDNVDIYSVFCALGDLSKKSDLNSEQAVNIVRLITQFTDKLQTNAQNLVATVFDMLDTLAFILSNKTNPSNLAAKDCMNLVGGLLQKIDIEIIMECGFNIEDGRIKSLDFNKLKGFAGEYMADCLDHLTFTITKSQNYEKIMSLLNVEAPGTVDANSLATLFSDLCKEINEKYFNDRAGTLEDVVTVTDLIDRILDLEPAVTLTYDMVKDMFFTFSSAMSRVAGINRNQIALEGNRVETVMSFVEKILGADSKIKSNLNVVYCSFRCLEYLLRRIVPTSIGYDNRMIELINGVAINEDIAFGKYEISLMFNLFEIIMRRNPNCLEAKEGLRLVGKLLNKVSEIYEKDRVDDIINQVLSIISLYAQNQENIEIIIEIIMECGFNIEDGRIKSLDFNKLKGFAGEYMAVVLVRVLTADLGKNTENKNQVNNNETNSTITHNGINSIENENETSNQNKNIKSPVNKKTNEKFNSTEKGNPVEALNNYKSADELLTSNVDKQTVSSYLANVKVSLWDEFKMLPSWLWFMIRNWKWVGLGVYAKAVKYYRDKQNQIQDVNKNKTNLKDKIKDAQDKNKQLIPKFGNGQEKGNDETLRNEE